jgi:DNA-directed RNA polymerase specialized sigma24 family protein
MVTNPARNFLLIEGEKLQLKDLEKKNKRTNYRDSFTLSDLSEHDSDPLGNLTNLEIVAGSCDRDTPTYQAELNQLIKKIRGIIESMPPKQREAMIEVYFNGLKPRHAAIKLNSNSNCITFLTHKGKEQLKKKLKNV